jgi:hypothetical protein
MQKYLLLFHIFIKKGVDKSIKHEIKSVQAKDPEDLLLEINLRTMEIRQESEPGSQIVLHQIILL